MKRKDDSEGRHKVTDRIDEKQPRTTKTAEMLAAQFDQRIVEIVRFLARTAAEKDYAELIAEAHRDTESEKEIH